MARQLSGVCTGTWWVVREVAMSKYHTLERSAPVGKQSGAVVPAGILAPCIRADAGRD